MILLCSMFQSCCVVLSPIPIYQIERSEINDLSLCHYVSPLSDKLATYSWCIMWGCCVVRFAAPLYSIRMLFADSCLWDSGWHIMAQWQVINFDRKTSGLRLFSWFQLPGTERRITLREWHGIVSPTFWHLKWGSF